MARRRRRSTTRRRTRAATWTTCRTSAREPADPARAVNTFGFGGQNASIVVAASRGSGSKRAPGTGGDVEWRTGGAPRTQRTSRTERDRTTNRRSCHKRCRPGRRAPSSHAPCRGRRPPGRTARTPVAAGARAPHHVRPGPPPELVVRPRASEADIQAAIAYHTSLARASARRRPRGAARARASDADRDQGRREARARISLIAQSEATALGVTYARISLRDQRSRWGSCSNRGTLSFNWRLVLAPHDVLDYVVVHEVCHLVELHHGPAFWQLVTKRRPQYQESKALARRARLGDPRVLAARIARGLAANF